MRSCGCRKIFLGGYIISLTIVVFFDRLNLKVQVLREKRIFANCKYFMGRTHWDKSCCELLAPNAEYFYCSEMLRPTIYYSKNFGLSIKHIVRKSQHLYQNQFTKDRILFFELLKHLLKMVLSILNGLYTE